MKKGLLIVISGPSGVGKGTIINELLKRLENAKLSVSCTTRGPREGEKDGVHYYFIKKEEFERRIAEGLFLEYMPVFDNYYGTPADRVEELTAAGTDVILDIDVKGAEAVKNKKPDAVTVFILPPSIEELEKRLKGRGTETEEQIQKRLSRADSEIRRSGSYDFCVVNGELSKAVSEIEDIIAKEHLKREV